MQDKVHELFKCLQDPAWYSYGFDMLKEKLRVTDSELMCLIYKLRKAVGVNVFVYENVKYVGLESRRLDYLQDKASNTNHVEKLIAAGFYKQQTQQNRPSRTQHTTCLIL
jgi:hypothetical protein